MAKKTSYKAKRDARRAATIIETADLVGVTARSVRRVLDAKQENEVVLTTFMEITERHNKLLQEVEQLVPFYN